MKSPIPTSGLQPLTHANPTLRQYLEGKRPTSCIERAQGPWRSREYPAGMLRQAAQISAILTTFSLLAGIGTAGLAGPAPGTLNIAIAGDPNTLNPINHSQAIEAFMGSMIFDPLIETTADGRLKPVLAAVVPSATNGGLSHDGKTVVYRLRRGVRWHDGVPFTSRDVAFSSHAAIAVEYGAGDAYTLVDRLETPDDFTVVVHLKKAYSPFISEWFAVPIGGGRAILPAHLLAKYRDLSAVPFNSAPIGTGAFVFERWERGRQLVFHANDGYFLGKPKVRRIVVSLVPKESTRTLLLRTGESDFNLLADAASARQLSSEPDVATHLLAASGFFGLELQTHRAPLDDVRVRRAIACALDRVTMVRKISGDFATPSVSNIGPDNWAYDPTVAPLPFAPARSRALLRRAGWMPAADGLLARNGKPLELTLFYPTESSSNESYALTIQEMLRAVGIAVDLKPTPLNTLFSDTGPMRYGTFDMLLSNYYAAVDPSSHNNFRCDEAAPNGFNVSRWCNHVYDRITSAALLEPDRGTRRRDYRRASQLLIDEVPEVFLYAPKFIELTRRGVAIEDGRGSFLPPYLWTKNP